MANPEHPSASRSSQRDKPREQRSGLTLGRLFGIEIRLDPSVVVIFTLVVASLGLALFPQWHPQWPIWLHWTTALAAGLLFFASLLAHELAHSVVAASRGVPVPRITLFLFGGVSEMSSEPDNAASEFLIAIVGPLASLILGVAFGALGSILAPPEFVQQLETDPESALASLSPVATLALWLGPVNVLLAVFNMVPGFPLDGGRVLRAAVWWGTGNYDRATRWAASGGQVVAWALIGIGVAEIVYGRFQGLWLVLVGWFLHQGASSTQRQATLQHRLEGLSVGDLMRTHFERVDADRSVHDFIEQDLLRSGQQVWPVTEGARTLGLIALADVAGVSGDVRRRVQVRERMRPLDPNEPLSPEMRARDALDRLSESQDVALPVMRADTLQGLIDRADILRWLAAHGHATSA